MSQNSMIILDHKIKSEVDKYGKFYYDEAKRIVTHMPKCPSKYTQGVKGQA